MRRAFLVHKRRIHPVLDQCRLVFHRLVHDGVEPVFRHDIQQPRHQRIARLEIFVMGRGGLGFLPAIARGFGDLGEKRRRHGVLARGERRIGGMREILRERLLVGFGISGAPVQQGVEVGDDDGVDDLRARRAEVVHSLVEHLGNLAEVVRAGLGAKPHRLAQNADARARQRVLVEQVRVAAGRTADAAGGEGVGGIVADHAVEQFRQVGDGARHRSERAVDGRPAGIHAAPAHQARGRAHAGDAVPNRGPADRGEAFLSHRGGGKIRRHARRRAAGGPARGALRVVDVARGAEQRAVRVAAAQLAQRRLGDENRPGLFEPGDDEGIPARHVILEQHRAERGRHSGDVGLVLHDERDSVQGSDEARHPERCVEPVGVLQRARIDRYQGVDPGALLVIGLDPVEIHLHQLPRAQCRGPVGRVNVGDRRLHDIEDIR